MITSPSFLIWGCLLTWFCLTFLKLLTKCVNINLQSNYLQSNLMRNPWSGSLIFFIFDLNVFSYLMILVIVFSYSMHVLRGVHQGSILDPKQFNIFTNDAPSIFSSKSILYADGPKLLGPALSCDDHTLLQNHLQLLGQWAEAWLLEFNGAKCHIIHIGKLNPCCSHLILGHPLSSINNKLDLSVTIDNVLKFGTHPKRSAAGAISTMGLIKHTISTHFSKIISLLQRGLVGF